MTPLDKHEEAAREALYGRHERGFIMAPLIGKENEPAIRRIAQALTNLEAVTEARVRRECAEIARSWADTARKLEKSLPNQSFEHAITADMANDIAEAILASGDTTDAK